MKTTTTDKLMNTLLVIPGIAILLGAFFNIFHYSFADTVVKYSLLSYVLISTIEIKRLRKIIKDLMND